MDKIFEFKQEKDVRRSYERCGLKFNPFPLGGEPSKDYPYVQISEKVSSEIIRFVDTVTSKKSWQGLSLIGENVSGKTRLLFSMERDINTQLNYANAIYINEPPTDSLKFFQKIISSCNLYSLTQIIANKPEHLPNFIKIVEKNIVKRHSLSAINKASIANEKKLLDDFGEYLKKQLPLDKNIRNAYSLMIAHYIITDIFKSKGLEISLENSSFSEIDNIRRFVSGEAVQASVLNKLGIKPINVDDSIMEKIIFPSFLQYNKLADKTVVYALIDEFQFVIDNVSKSKIASILNNIIAMAQSNLIGFVMVLSCLPDAWNYTIRVSNSFAERFNMRVFMPPLSKDTSIEMTRQYLNFGRMDKDETLSPFTVDAINKILEISKYNIRAFLQTCGLILNLFIDNKKAVVVDENFVKEYIDKLCPPDAGLKLWI